MKFLVFVLLTLFPNITEAQKTISLSYPFGGLKPNAADFTLFQNELKKVEFKNIDSVHFIGNSDSIGTFLSNFRTTEYRSRKLKKYIIGQAKQSISYAILPDAGNLTKEKGSTRVIQVIIYSSSFFKPKKSEGEIPKGCYRVAYSDLKNYNQTYNSRGKKSFIQLERPITKSGLDQPELFSGTINKDGNFEVVQLKWKTEKTGKSWWAKEIEVTEIPNQDFDRFKIFTIEEGPCTSCHEDFSKDIDIQNSAFVLEVDKPLSENIQFRTPLFFNNYVNVRIPQNYIDLSKEYFQQSTGDKQIVWEEKDKDFYYAKVKQRKGVLEPIERKILNHSASDCQNISIAGYVSKLLIAPSNNRVSGYNFIETGFHFQNGTQIPYAAIGLFAATKQLELEFLGGFHAKSALYGSIRGRYTILSLPFPSILYGNQWKHTFEKNRFWFTNLYLGTEYKASIGNRTQNYLEPNIHLGLSFSQNNGSIFHRIFIQFGYAVNFIEESPRDSYELFQLGAQFQLGKKTYAPERGVL